MTSTVIINGASMSFLCFLVIALLFWNGRLARQNQRLNDTIRNQSAIIAEAENRNYGVTPDGTTLYLHTNKDTLKVVQLGDDHRYAIHIGSMLKAPSMVELIKRHVPESQFTLDIVEEYYGNSGSNITIRGRHRSGRAMTLHDVAELLNIVLEKGGLLT